MGTYLSTPVTEKCEEEGTHLTCSQTPVAWGVVDMQGWRKSMEDAHVATTMDDFKVFGVFDGHGGAEVARICQLYMVSVLTQQPTWQQALDNVPYEGNPAQSPLGLALRSSFHALDRMIGDPERRDELVALRTNKPGPGERKDAENIPPPRQFVTMDESMVQPSSSADASTVSLMDKAEDNSGTTSPASPQSMDTLSNGETPTPKENVSQEAVEEEKKGDDELMEHEQEDDSDSDEAVGQQEAVNDRNLDDDESPDGEADESVPASGKMTEMFQRLLHMSGSPANGTGVVKLGGVGGENSSPLQPVSAPGAVGSSPYTFSASTLHAGRMICTLPDHPIHAGATAVVAVMIGKTLVVANAGDSRAVLCRDGAAFALSYDHKPQQDQESSRIRKAGGFVNQFGRVNGNLNLSRSIGDLKYKQAYFLPPAKQMITAEPDIIETKIDDTDEFLLIGCDGIWDCLSNEQAVVYVRQRIDTKTPVEIGREMLDDIISVDPRATQGIGGDNMTILIIDLQPHKRSYRQREE